MSRPDTIPRLALESLPAGTGRQVVVAIGIDGYVAWPHLGNAVHDARKTAELFGNLGFIEARALYDHEATGAALRKLVTDDLRTLGVNDSLVLFFAGHGGTRTQVLQDGTSIKTGYLIPVDADNKDGEVATWIRLDTWLDDIARLPANHILVILDACHSGIALDALIKWRDMNTWQDEPVDALSRRRSRRVITSALDDQLALDGGPIAGHSLFTGCLLEALTGGLSTQAPSITGSELALHLQKRVTAYPNSRQTPDFGAFELDDRGELVIPLRRPPSASQTLAAHVIALPRIEPTIATTWSHLELQLHGQNTTAHGETAALVTERDELLEAIATLTWGGKRPADPLLEVTSSYLLAPATPLLHETTLVPSPEPGTATWRIRIPVPHTRLRSRRVTVRCVGAGLAEHCYLVPRAGSLCAAALWFAFAGFVLAWLWPIAPMWLSALLAAFGIASGLWSALGGRSFGISRSPSLVEGVFSMWESALAITALAATLAVVVPPRVVALVSNTTGKEVPLGDGTTLEPGVTRRAELAARVRGWRPAAPFCRCGNAECRCSEGTPSRLHGVEHLAFSCMSGECDGVIEHVTRGGSARIVRPPGLALSPILVEAGLAGERMTLSAGKRRIVVKDIAQTGALELRIVPDAPQFSIDVAGSGSLACTAGATRIVGVPIDGPVAGASVMISIDGIASRWTWNAGAAGPARACATAALATARKVVVAFGTSTADEERVECSGAGIERVAQVPVTPPSTAFWMKRGDVASRWSSRTAAPAARACLGPPGDLELDPIAAGHRVTLPPGPPTSAVRVRHTAGDERTAATVRCPPEGILRGVALVGVGNESTWSVASATVVRIGAGTGATCDAPAAQSSALRHCELDDAQLVCRYVGPCRLQADDRVTRGGRSDACPGLARTIDAQRARATAARQMPPLQCTEVFQCE